MARTPVIASWNPLEYCSPEELSGLDERFTCVLRDKTCLVFWTGVPPQLAQRWAAERGLLTLALAMGPLYGDGDVGSVKYGKSVKAWSKYMKGASGRFAEYACRDGRRALVLTRPPPNIYSTRKRSNFRDLEEPILKGAVGGPGTTRIDYAYPRIVSGEMVQYQTWTLDKSSTWYIFFTNLLHTVFTTLLAKGHTNRVDISIENEVAIEVDQLHEVVVQSLERGKEETQDKNQQAKGTTQRRDEMDQWTVHDKNEMGRRQAMSEQLKLETRNCNRKLVELEQRRVQEKKEIKRKMTELEQWIVQAKKENRRKRAELEQKLKQQIAQEKEIKRKRAELAQRIAQAKKENIRKRAKLEQQRKQQIAQEKEIKGKRVELEQQLEQRKVQEKREIKRKRAELEQRIAQARNENKRQRAQPEQASARVKIELKRGRMRRRS